MSSNQFPSRHRVANLGFVGLTWMTGLVGILVPLVIGIHLLAHGGIVFDPGFLFDRPRGSPLGSEGGIFPAISGSFFLVAIGLLVALPSAVGAAVYLTEFAKSPGFIRTARLIIESLAAVPSIIFGLFGFAFIVVALELGTSLLAGSLVLAMVMFPIILITAQEAFDAVGPEFREASLSLGVDRTEWVFRVLMPKSGRRILAGVVLAVGHAMGSAAPVLFTASVFYSRGQIQLDQPVMTLPTHLYFLVSEGVSYEYAYGTAAVLVFGLLAFNSAAMWLRKVFQE
ncbi:MAG: phosphate ABC transporter permease PstA [Fibrobacterota bacterium]